MARPVLWRHSSSREHDTGAHPERIERIVAIEQTLEAHDWLGWEARDSPVVSAEALHAVHPPAHVARLEALCAAGGGAIVNITSIEAENPAPDHSHYNAAKGGLLMYTRSCALELAALNIRVNSVAPGLIWREGIEQAWPDGVGRWQRTAPLKRLGQPEDVADAMGVSRTTLYNHLNALHR
jgi:NAD(P)-dependent dehydrogenase (short-subunit alcohol dehydrogenase family)